MVSHIKFVSIPTNDQDRSLKFWTDVVGFKVLTDLAYELPDSYQASCSDHFWQCRHDVHFH